MPKRRKCSEESFPLNDWDQYYELPPAAQAHKCTTEQSVEQAMVSQTVKKAHYPDKLSYRAIRLLRKWDKMRIVGLTKADVRMGSHLPVWKPASGVVIESQERRIMQS